MNRGYLRRRRWHPTPVLLPGKSHGWRSLGGYSPWGREESETTEQLHFDFSLPCSGEGNGNPLQCSCLENPRDGGAWWAAVYAVAQSQKRLKLLTSSRGYLSPSQNAALTEKVFFMLYVRLYRLKEWSIFPEPVISRVQSQTWMSREPDHTEIV